MLPLLCARAQPSGVVDQRSYDEMLGRFLKRLEKILPVDGMLLDLHGAMATERHDDAEGAFITATRELVGKETPIVVTLDLHANISQQMADQSDVIIGFDTYRMSTCMSEESRPLGCSPESFAATLFPFRSTGNCRSSRSRRCNAHCANQCNR